MRYFKASSVLYALSCCIKLSTAVASTDSYRDADFGQTGYLPNHNMDPSVVDSAQFGQLWKVAFNAKEQFFAKPLVFTPASTGVQILFLASSQNNIRTLNAKTGAVLNTRLVHPPFLQSDIGCTDIANTIGIIGTPIIDPKTEIAYFFSKTYIPNYRVPGNTGTANGVYYFHGVSLDTLQDVPGYPILIDGSVADNEPLDTFIGGVILQRPALVQVGNYVYGGFGGHCDMFNYTGVVVGIDIVNKNIATQWAAVVGPQAQHQSTYLQGSTGGGGGIWQSGVGLSTDGNRLFLATGNGNAHQNDGVPASGRSACQTLGESVVNLAINPATGKLTTQDYFQPYDYQNMDGGDQDFGSSGVTLLDPTVFKGTGVNRIAVGSGKNGKIYFMNADNLGGYKQGSGGSDGVLQTINTQKAVFGGSGSYPLEGGYLYSTPVGYATYVYQLGFDSGGVPQFSQVGITKEISAGRVGVGVPTITSLNGRPGTAILWMTDPNAGIRAWYAVPKSDGTMKSIPMPQIGGVVKFQRPVFGDGRVYTTDSNGALYCLGSPVNLPLNCSAPLDFGDVALGSASTQNLSCTALTNINQIVSVQTLDSNFVVRLSDLPKGFIAAGQKFTFPVIWNLTNTVVTKAANASFGNTSPGIKSTPLTFTTNNAVAGFATVFPVSLIGNQISQAPYLDTTPSTVDFGGVVLVGETAEKSIGSTMTIRNKGLSPLSISGYAWTQDELEGDVDWTNVTQSDNGTFVLGPGFLATNLPPVNTVIDPSQSIIVNLVFEPQEGTGNYFSFFNIWTNGGVTNTILEGSASTQPIANMSISTSEGGWTDVTKQSEPVMDFGYVQAGTTESLQIRICNEGGSVLHISKSKPPNGVFYISDPAELREELGIAPGSCAYGTVLMSPPTARFNQPDQSINNTWTLNAGDLDFGVHVVQIKGVVRTIRVGPQDSFGSPVYNYLGCFRDGTNGRLLPKQLYAGPNNTNGMCQTLAYPGGNIFAGTKYNRECYGGNAPPPVSLQVQDSLCNYACTGNQYDTCGGNVGGQLISVYYDPTRYTPGRNVTDGPGGMAIQQTVGNYTYIGCWSDNVNGKALTGPSPVAPINGTTYASCATACKGYQYFGVEAGNQCKCGNTVINGAALQSSTNPDVNLCNLVCKGNATQYCGGTNRMNLFQLKDLAKSSATSSTSTSSSAVSSGTSSLATSLSQSSSASSSSFASLSAIPSASSTSTFATSTILSSSSSASSSLVSPSSSVSLSLSTIRDTSPTTSSVSSLSSAVSSSSVSLSGSSTGLYSTSSDSPTMSSSSGLSSSSAGTSTTSSDLSTSSSSSTASSSSTMSSSSTGPSSTSSESSALSSSSMISSSSVSSSFSTSSTVSTPSSSSIALSSSATSSSSTVSSSSPGSSSSVSSSSSKSSSPPSSTSSLAAQWTALGCYADPTGSRALTDLKNPVPAANVTNDSCAKACAGYSYYGTEYGQECYCGYDLNAGSAPATSGCNKPCSGDNRQICGGANRLNLYKSTNPPVTVGNSTGIQYLGCYSEATNGKALYDKQLAVPAANVTVEACMQACSSYSYFGVERGNQCFCGNTIRAGSALVQGSTVGKTGCNMLCQGNSTEFCGGVNRLNMYAKLM